MAVPGRRSEELDAARDERREAASAAAPSEPSVAALLALQQSAGNAAVGRMLQRKFYERTDSGSYVWHAESPDEQWQPTGETTWWLMPFWRYPVYKRAAAVATPPVADETPEVEEEAPTKETTTRKRRRRKKKPTAAPAPEEELVPTTAEPPPTTAPPESKGEEHEDDDGFTTVKSKATLRWEAAASFDVGALARAIDEHTGAPAEILETFNQMFNGMDAQGLLGKGSITDAYISSYDRGRGFSVEITIPGLDNWVLHAHLRSDGTLQEGQGAVHYKRISERGQLGVSIALLQKQINALIPDAATCHGYAVNTRKLPLPERPSAALSGTDA